MLIFEISITNMPLPQKGLAPILKDLPHIYVAYAIQATISSVKHKPLFHRNEMTWNNMSQELFSPRPVAVCVSIAV